MKNILCALMDTNAYILRSIYETARKENWQIEQCGQRLPRHWSGDGVIADYQTFQALSVIDRFETTPIVTRTLHPGRENIRSVLPNTRRIAKISVDYFLDKGFTRIAAMADGISRLEENGIPQDILEAVRQELHSHQLPLELCFWESPRVAPETSNYQHTLKRVKLFLAKIQPPFALLLATFDKLPLVYRALFEMGLRVPEDVAVLCNTDNWLCTENAIVPTSYIAGEFLELGNQLAELLKHMIAGEKLSASTIYTSASNIVTRRSTDTLAFADSRLAGAIQFYQKNYANMIMVEDAATAVGISRVLLTRLFRAC